MVAPSPLLALGVFLPWWEARLGRAEQSFRSAWDALDGAARLGEVEVEVDEVAVDVLPDDLPDWFRGLALYRSSRAGVPAARAEAERLEAACRGALRQLRSTNPATSWEPEEVGRDSRIDRSASSRRRVPSLVRMAG